ncbi:hypothetical protein SAMD00019534_000500 [Acytostelium subglobosum LB1]|uniref:hypothetical protein n=1 Tax=Acytostelium subglobosum LB1 TaxID=1410327 RepID=UPI0006449843|nr:hypothetical protein SAMD00019534_000500 [Acytostelium subglobosum LB1]GAM16875.1 hypothetical protein SAMD00019534_000500 [Acytostelium subglobosum LB1]|eukprot:XP_012758937.1 hypothetical protein SAMD00019534_000500 [Acytostelium subglobosum LB1]
MKLKPSLGFFGSSSSNSNNSNNNNNNNSKGDSDKQSTRQSVKRVDSISKYKAKGILRGKELQQHQHDSDSDESSDDEPPNLSSKARISTTSSVSFNNTTATQTTTNTNGSGAMSQKQIATEAIDTIAHILDNKNMNQPPNNSSTSLKMMFEQQQQQQDPRTRSDSLDSDDPDFGYGDMPIYKTISKTPLEQLKPITNPIPNRPSIQVDISTENELIYHSLIALRTSIRIGSDAMTSINQNEFELIKKYKASISEKRTTIKDFAPNVFNDLRNRQNIYPATFLKSWSSYISSSIQSAKPSNAFTIYSSDRKFILKTISKSDSIKLRKLLPHYYNHLVFNPNSLLVRYLALFRVEKKYKQNFYVVLLSNVYHTCCNVDQVISTRMNGDEHIRHKLSHRNIHLDLSVKHSIYQQIEKDTIFLSSTELTDYNMVIGINRVDSKNEQVDELIKDAASIEPSSSSSLINGGVINSDSASPTPNTQSPSLDQLNASVLLEEVISNGGSSSGALAAATTPSTPKTPSSSASSQPTNDLDSSLDCVSNQPTTIVDPVKTIPRLLFFIEEIECITKANNHNISKSLKKSFLSLPTSWAFDDNNNNNNTNGHQPSASPSSLAYSMTSMPSHNNNHAHHHSMQFSQSPISSSQLIGRDNEHQHGRNGFYSDQGPSNEVYYFGIVDIFSGASVGDNMYAPNNPSSPSSPGSTSPLSMSSSTIPNPLSASSSSNKRSTPIPFVSKMRSQPTQSTGYHSRFLNHSKNLLFLDTSVQMINVKNQFRNSVCISTKSGTF